jgi:hypothetical protein
MSRAKADEPFIVTAIHDGYLGQYRRAGDVFLVTEQQFADRWMRRGEDKAAAPAGVDLKRQARQEALAAGGANAALSVALADLKEARDEVATLTEKVADLEAKLAATASNEKDKGEDDAPAEEEVEEATVPTAAAPVQRVRRTAVQG